MNTDLSVVIVTVGRQSLWRAVESIFRQKFDGHIQLLIGLDVDAFGQAEILRQRIIQNCPPNRSVTWIGLGYSTSQKHGGAHKCFFGGSLRTALSFLAESKYVLYLDDDDWLGESHCADVLQAIGNKKWAYAHCYYADGNTGEPLCEDLLESVGVNQGIFRDKLGGFVRPSGLLIDKLELSPILHLWSESPFPGGDGEDRLIFNQLRNLEHGFTGKASVYYSLDPKDALHPIRMEYLKSQGKSFKSDVKKESVR